MNIQLSQSEMAAWVAVTTMLGGLIRHWGPPLVKWLFAKKAATPELITPPETAYFTNANSKVVYKDEHETLCAERMRSIDRRLMEGEKQFDKITTKLDEQFTKYEEKIDSYTKFLSAKIETHERRILTLERNAIIGN